MSGTKLKPCLSVELIMSNIKTAVQEEIRTLMERVMINVLINDPFIPEIHHAKKPIYAALVPDEIFKGSHFERRFTTPFGGVWEKLAIAAAHAKGKTAKQGHSIEGQVRSERLRRIQEVLNNLEHTPKGTAKVKPNWAKELAYILEGEGEKIPVAVTVDVFVDDAKAGEKLAFEIKAPQPNSDQTKVSKEKIFKLYAMEPRLVTGAFYALPYNPYGTKENYTWPFPARWFDMRNDAVVLIGEEFWDKLGGPGTYRAFIEAVNEMGEEYRNRIYREFLMIEPPNATEPLILK